MPESDDQREDRARDLAIAGALRDAEVDRTIASHESRLNAINGNIERLGTAMKDLGGKVATQDAVEGALAKQREQGVSNRQWLITCAIMVFVVVLAQVLQKALG